MNTCHPPVTLEPDANRIIHGDCNAVLRTLPAESVGLVLTDPPYGVNYRDRSGRTVANDAALENVLGAFGELSRLPITETGYRSHFADREEIEAAGGPVAFVTAALDEAAQSPEWLRYVEESRQGDLFGSL